MTKRNPFAKDVPETPSKAPSSPMETTAGSEQRPDHTGVIRGADEAEARRMARYAKAIHDEAERLGVGRVMMLPEIVILARAVMALADAEAEDQRAAYGFLEVEVAEQVAKVTERDEVIENWRAAHHRLWVECDSAITSLRDRNATIERVRALLNEATNMPAHYSIEGAAGPCQSCDQPASTHYHLIGGGCMNSDLQAADDRRAL